MTLNLTAAACAAAPNWKVAYFDQRRAQLDEQQSVIDNLADGRQFIDIAGKQRHVISYLQDFLFMPDRCRTTRVSAVRW